jgi:polar amino acid transport system substrate-binding protein
MHKAKCLGLIALCLVSLAAFPAPKATSAEYQIYAGNFPPYVYPSKGQMTGPYYEIVHEINTKTGQLKPTRMLIWSRAISECMKPGHLTFPVARIRERDTKLQWIGPIQTVNLVFLKRKNDKRIYRDLEEFRKSRIGIITGMAGNRFLEELDFNNLIHTPNPLGMFKELFANNVDAVYYLKAPSYASILGYLEKQDKDIDAVLVYQSLNLYLACSTDIPKEVVALWQAELDRMKADGRFKAIMDKYGY